MLANTHTDTRAGTITVAFTDGSRLSHAVAQEHPVSCSYVVAPDDGYFRHAGGSGSFDVTVTPRDCRWTVAAESEYYGVHVTSSPSGTGSGRVTYVVTPALGAYDKDTRIFVAGLSGVNPYAEFKVHIAAQ